MNAITKQKQSELIISLQNNQLDTSTAQINTSPVSLPNAETTTTKKVLSIEYFFNGTGDILDMSVSVELSRKMTLV